MEPDRRTLLRLAPWALSSLALSGTVTGCSPGYAADEVLAPDLEGGFIVFNSGGLKSSAEYANSWITTIQAVLQRNVSGTTETAYLGKECRAEGVDPVPFEGRDNYEFVGLKGWDGNFIIRTGADLTPEIEYEKVNTDLVQAGFDFDVKTSERVVHLLGFEAVLSMLRRSELGQMRRIHVRLDYQHDGVRFTLYTRCKYINYPHAVSTGVPYLQPIVGRVLVWQDNRLKLAYVVFHVVGGVVRGLQFKVQDKAAFGSTGISVTDYVTTLSIDPATVSAEFYHY